MRPTPSKMSTVAATAMESRATPRESSQAAVGFFGDYRRRSDAFGQAMTWLCGGALALNLLLVIGIMACSSTTGWATSGSGT